MKKDMHMISYNDSINEDSNDSDQPVPEFVQYCKFAKYEQEVRRKLSVLASTSDRYASSDRAGAAIANAVLQDCEIVKTSSCADRLLKAVL